MSTFKFPTGPLILLLCSDLNSGWDLKLGIYAHLGFVAQFMLDAWATVDILFADREILYCEDPAC
jgi:hypothetical protein